MFCGLSVLQHSQILGSSSSGREDCQPHASLHSMGICLRSLVKWLASCCCPGGCTVAPHLLSTLLSVCL